MKPEALSGHEVKGCEYHDKWFQINPNNWNERWCCALCEEEYRIANKRIKEETKYTTTDGEVFDSRLIAYDHELALVRKDHEQNKVQDSGK